MRRKFLTIYRRIYKPRTSLFYLGNQEQSQYTEKGDSLQGIPDLEAGGTRPSISGTQSTTQSVFSDDTPPSSTPAIDANGMPLPRRVDEMDVAATRIHPLFSERMICREHILKVMCCQIQILWLSLVILFVSIGEREWGVYYGLVSLVFSL